MAQLMDNVDKIVLPQGEVKSISDLDGEIWQRTFPKTASGEKTVSFVGNRSRAVKSAKFYGKSYQEHYIGKNTISYMTGAAKQTTNGLTLVNNYDGTYTINGTKPADKAANFAFESNGKLYESGKYTAAMDVISGEILDEEGNPDSFPGKMRFYVYWTGYKLNFGGPGSIGELFRATQTYTAELVAEPINYHLYFGISSQAYTFNDVVIRVQIEKGDTFTGFEPDTGGLPAPRTDYPVPIKTDDPVFTTSGGETVDLSGLHLRSIGNVRDEWDAITGNGVRRIGYIASYSGETVGDTWVSTTGELTTGAEVIYVLSSPTEFTSQPQIIHQTHGTNTITETSGNLNSTEVEIVYYGGENDN